MITDKQLDFALEEVQAVQRKHIGKKIGLTITTAACGTHEFIVTAEYNYKPLEKGSCIALEKTFEFLKEITDDECVNYINEIKKIAESQ